MLAPHQTTQIPYQDPGETYPPRQGSRLICTQTRNKEEKEAEEEEEGEDESAGVSFEFGRR